MPSPFVATSLLPPLSPFCHPERSRQVGFARDDKKEAIEFLNKSVYHDHLANAGLFFAQLQSRSRQLKALSNPRIGDSLLSADGTPWLANLTKAAPKLDMSNLDQVAALPLGSHLKVDAWNDKVFQLNAKPLALLSAREKMPFEVTPILFRLTRYADPALAAAPATPGAGRAITAQTAATGAVHNQQ